MTVERGADAYDFNVSWCHQQPAARTMVETRIDSRHLTSVAKSFALEA